MWYLPYNKSLLPFSRNLRNNSTRGEVLLWMSLRGGSLGYTFNRQKPLGNYIVDFYSKPLLLVIEVDGGYHFTPKQMAADKKRQEILLGMGLHVLRFPDQQVRKNLPSVVTRIRQYILAFEQAHPGVKASRKRQPVSNSPPGKVSNAIPPTFVSPKQLTHANRRNPSEKIRPGDGSLCP